MIHKDPENFTPPSLVGDTVGREVYVPNGPHGPESTMFDQYLIEDAFSKKSKREHCDVILRDRDQRALFFNHGFWPYSDLKENIAVTLYQVLALTPNRGALRARLERNGNGFKMSVALTRVEGSILVVALGSTPQEVLQGALNSIYAKIFAGPTSGSMEYF